MKANSFLIVASLLAGCGPLTPEQPCGASYVYSSLTSVTMPFV